MCSVKLASCECGPASVTSTTHFEAAATYFENMRFLISRKEALTRWLGAGDMIRRILGIKTSFRSHEWVPPGAQPREVRSWEHSSYEP